MALLSRTDIESALSRMGELAQARSMSLELLVVGGAAMVLGYNARASTHDIDAVILEPTPAAEVRLIAADVAVELGWPNDWFNDGAKGFVRGPQRGRLLFEAVGIRVFQPPVEQLLAMKLSAWRDDVDIGDASILLQAVRESLARDEVWSLLEPYLIPGRELTASFALDDLWETP